MGNGHTVRMLWVNYTGDDVLQADIPDGQAEDLRTFLTHPFKFFDVETNELLRVFVARAEDNRTEYEIRFRPPTTGSA